MSDPGDPDPDDLAGAFDELLEELLAPAVPNVAHGVSNWQDVEAAHNAVDAEPRPLTLPPGLWGAAVQALGLDQPSRPRPLTDAELDEMEEWRAMGLEWYPDDEPPLPDAAH